MKKKTAIISAAAAIAGVALITVLTVVLINVFKDKATPASKTGNTLLTVGSVQASAGDTVKVPVKISGNPGAMGYLLEFNYDASAMKYTSYEKGDFLTDYELADNNGSLKFVSIEDKDIKKDGVLLYLKFAVNKEAKSGSYDVKLIMDENSICNYDEQTIPATSKDGTIKIK